MKYMEVLMDKMGKLDAWKPIKLEMPKGLKLPKLDIPTWNDNIDPAKAEKEKQKKLKAEEQRKTLESPGSMDVTIKFKR